MLRYKNISKDLRHIAKGFPIDLDFEPSKGHKYMVENVWYLKFVNHL